MCFVLLSNVRAALLHILLFSSRPFFADAGSTHASIPGSPRKRKQTEYLLNEPPKSQHRVGSSPSAEASRATAIRATAIRAAAIRKASIAKSAEGGWHLSSAAERLEAKAGDEALRAWTDVERTLFAIGSTLYRKDFRAIRQVLLPKKSLGQLVEHFYLVRGRELACHESVAGVSVSCSECGARCSYGSERVRCQLNGCAHFSCGRCCERLGGWNLTSARKSPFWSCGSCVRSHLESLSLETSPDERTHRMCASCGDVKPEAQLERHPALHTNMCTDCFGVYTMVEREAVLRSGEVEAVATLALVPPADGLPSDPLKLEEELPMQTRARRHGQYCQYGMGGGRGGGRGGGQSKLRPSVPMKAVPISTASSSCASQTTEGDAGDDDQTTKPLLLGLRARQAPSARQALATALATLSEAAEAGKAQYAAAVAADAAADAAAKASQAHATARLAAAARPRALPSGKTAKERHAMDKLSLSKARRADGRARKERARLRNRAAEAMAIAELAAAEAEQVAAAAAAAVAAEAAAAALAAKVASRAAEAFRATPAGAAEARAKQAREESKGEASSLPAPKASIMSSCELFHEDSCESPTRDSPTRDSPTLDGTVDRRGASEYLRMYSPSRSHRSVLERAAVEGAAQNVWSTVCMWCAQKLTSRHAAYRCTQKECGGAVCLECLQRNASAEHLAGIQRVHGAGFLCAGCDPSLQRRAQQLKIPKEYTQLARNTTRRMSGRRDGGK